MMVIKLNISLIPDSTYAVVCVGTHFHLTSTLQLFPPHYPQEASFKSSFSPQVLLNIPQVENQFKFPKRRPSIYIFSSRIHIYQSFVNSFGVEFYPLVPLTIKYCFYFISIYFIKYRLLSIFLFYFNLFLLNIDYCQY